MQFAVCEWDLGVSNEAVASLVTNGVTAVEAGARFLTDRSESEIAKAARRYSAAGIRIHACHAPFGGEDDLSLLDEEARQKAVASHERALERTALAGAQCMVIHPSAGRLDPEELQKRREKLLPSLEAVIRAAERTGVRLALENMLPQYLGGASDTIRQIIEHFASPFLDVCFDTGHAHLNSEGLLPAFENLRPHIITFHLQDNDGNHDRHLQPPYGTIDWAEFARALEPAEFPFPWSVETGPWNGADWRVMLREARALFSGGLLTFCLGDRQVRAICQGCGRYCFGTPQDWFCGCDG